jgi:hypothetical protein
MKLFLLIFFATTLLFGEIGQVTVVRGEASVERDLKNIKVYTYMGLFNQDVVRTKQGRMQIQFNDNTVISLGRDSKFVIKEYFYAPGSDKVNATFKIEHGFVKTITGIIGKMMPEMFILETSVTKIRPNGTIWSVRVDESGEYYSVSEGKITLNFKDTEDRVVELVAGESMSISIDSSGSENTVKSFQKNYTIQQKVETVAKDSTDSTYENRVEKESSSLREEQDINKGTSVDDTGKVVGDSSNGHGNKPEARKLK